MTRLGLMMIVKDEAAVIERCLASARRLVDWWVIVDTGSSDGTQGLVREAMSGIPGELHERPWVDFGHNRQEALDLAIASPHRGAADYAVWIDADEHFRHLPDRLPELVDDAYHLNVDYAGVRYSRLAVVRLDSPWRWRGPIHEYLDLEGATHGTLEEPTVWVEHDGARSTDPDTYRRDLDVIDRALTAEPDEPRMQFYRAQTLADLGRIEEAVGAYAVRIANPLGWDQERWVARYRTGLLLERLGAPPADIVDVHQAAYQACPWRAEPLVELARLERQRERFEVALLYARAAAALPMPGGEGLFVDVDTYRWRAWDEVAVACYWTDRFAEGEQAAQRALAMCPDDERLQANLAWCREKLGGAGQP